MIKTQIQLPDALYREAKRVAEEREMSLAEVMRRGVEYVVRAYPALGGKRHWTLPKAVKATLRPNLTLADLRDVVVDDTESAFVQSVRKEG